MSLRLTTISLIAGIALGLARADWIIGQVLALHGLTDFRWIYVVQLIGNSLFLSPLPLILVLIHRTDATLVISRNLGYLTLATGAIYGVLCTTPALLGWISGLHRAWTNLQFFEGVTIADKTSHWMRSGGTADALGWARASVTVFSQLAFTVFMLAIFPQASAAPDSEARPSNFLRVTALWATIMAGVAVVSSIGRQIYAAINFNDGRLDVWLGMETRGAFVIRNALSTVPFVCWMIAAFIVYRSQRFTPAEASPRAHDA